MNKLLSPPQMISLATALARKNKVDVKFDNKSTAATDGKTIVLPLTSKENSWIVRGYLDHEVGHVRLTDFETIPNETALHKSLWNVLEDVRIEGRMAEAYPGMATNYRALIRELRAFDKRIFSVRPEDSPDKIICGYISLLLRTEYLRQSELDDLAVNTRQVFVDMFGLKLESAIRGIVLPYSKVRQPQDVVHMVYELVSLLKSQQKPEKEEVNKPGGPESEKSSGSESDQDSQSEQNTPGEPIQQALDSQEELQDMGEQLKSLALEGGQSLPVAAPVEEKSLKTHGYVKQPIKVSNRLVSQLSGKLNGLLQSYNLDHSKPGLSGNRIARNRVHRIKTGEPRLFLRRSPVRQINTAVNILLDNSSSMRNRNRFEMTRTTALALTKVLASVRGLTLGITVFPAVYPHDETTVAEILRPGENPGKTLLYPPKPKGSTPMEAGIRYVASSLCQSQEPRKILLILTDGEPNSREKTSQAIHECLELGIEVACLGIEQMGAPELFPHHELVKDVQDLPQQTFQLFEKLVFRQGGSL